MKKTLMLIMPAFILLCSCASAGFYKAGGTGALQIRFAVDGPVSECAVIKDMKGADIFVEKEVLFSSQDIDIAAVVYNQYGRPAIRVQLTNPAGARFEEITGKNAGRKMAIIVDGVCVFAAMIQERIPGGDIIINGDFTAEEADGIARKIAGK
jgi:preprotein translocase subunit SecD